MIKKLLMILFPAVRRMEEALQATKREAEFAEAAHRARLEHSEKVGHDLMKLVTQEREAAARQMVEISRLRLDVAHEQERAQAKAHELARLKRQRNVSWAKPEKSLSVAELRAAFDVGADDPLWRAVMQVLDDAIGDVLDQVTLPPSGSMTEEIRTHTAGGGEQLRLFQKTLLTWQATAAVEEESEDLASKKAG
jgi:hypothetical protein